MNLRQAYHAVNAVLDTLDYGALFAGFHRYKCALYTGSEICLDGQMIPYQDDFRGNTALEYGGEPIAIWNLEADPVEDAELLAYFLVHEMFHCHQRANNEKRYPSELVLLHYPGDLENFQKKYNENLYLADAWQKHDEKAFRAFARIRMMRMKAYPAMVRQELMVETIEGMAEYVGLKALQTINREKFAVVVEEHLQKLRAQDGCLFDVRRSCYYSGALYALCLDRLGGKIQNVFDGEQTVYEQNPINVSDGSAVEIKQYDFIPHQYAMVSEKREKLIAECIGQGKYTPCKALICGYDPMNMFRVGDFIYCKQFVCLDAGGTIQTVNATVVLQLEENSDQTIRGYYCAKQHP